jgi:hypothetical protein
VGYNVIRTACKLLWINPARGHSFLPPTCVSQATILDEIAQDFRDSDGYPLLSTCIIASTATVAAKEEKEQAVRLVAKRWPSAGLGRLDVTEEKGKNSLSQKPLQQRECSM